MKPIVFLGLLLALTGCMANLPQLGEPNKKLSIQTSENDISAPLSDDGKIHHNFRIENVSESTIRILRVATSCGCAVATMDKTDLLPTESCDLSVEFKPAVQRKSASISVVTDDKINPVVQFRLTALFSAADLSTIEYLPRRIQLAPGKPAQVFLKITDSEPAQPQEIGELEFTCSLAGVRANRAKAPIDWSRLLIWEQNLIPDEKEIICTWEDGAGQRISFVPIELTIDPDSDFSKLPCLLTARLAWRGNRILVTDSPLMVDCVE